MTRNNVAQNYREEGNKTYKRQNLEVVDTKRNPYLVEYQPRRKVQYKNTVQEREIQRTSRSNNQIAKRRKKRAQKRRKLMVRRGIFLLACVIMMWVVISLFTTLITQGLKAAESGENNENWMLNQRSANTERNEDQLIQGLSLTDYGKHPIWTEDFLTPNEYSRPGDALTEINSVFVHYTANPGTSAAQNRSYFEQLKDTHERSVSSHFIIGYEGEIIQCVPLDEIAYAVQTRNEDSISIECCYLAEDGSFTQETYDSLIKLLQWLVEVYDLDVDEDVLRHYDCGGKKCPIYYTEHEDAWETLKEDVKTL